MNPEGNDDKFPKLPDGSRDIIHSHNHVDTWKQMEKLLEGGKVKAIGVSNVRLDLLVRCPAKTAHIVTVQQTIPAAASAPCHCGPSRQPD